MPLWRCPHCATPQPESSRCWLCRRSTTTCGACRHYRRGVAGGLGLCGQSPRRLALRGTEVRPCWEAMPGEGDALSVRERAGTTARGRVDPEAQKPHRTFVPVDELRAPASAALRDADPKPTAGAAAPRWSLWGDAEA